MNPKIFAYVATLSDRRQAVFHQELHQFLSEKTAGQRVSDRQFWIWHDLGVKKACRVAGINFAEVSS